jgi:uncharacterized membrane protein
MKNIFLLLIFVILVAVSCKKNEAYTPTCGSTVPSFATNVKAIITTNCAKSNCHSANGPQSPFTSYIQIKSAASGIRGNIISGNMPKTGSLTTEEKNMIVCWIDAGAANN